jgi:hypothetical protein
MYTGFWLDARPVCGGPLNDLSFGAKCLVLQGETVDSGISAVESVCISGFVSATRAADTP